MVTYFSGMLTNKEANIVKLFTFVDIGNPALTTLVIEWLCRPKSLLKLLCRVLPTQATHRLKSGPLKLHPVLKVVRVLGETVPLETEGLLRMRPTTKNANAVIINTASVVTSKCPITHPITRPVFLITAPAHVLKDHIVPVSKS